MLIIGLMSGTSVDAIDAALVRMTRKPGGTYNATVLHHHEHPWPKAIRERLLAVMAPAKTSTEEICALNVLVAHHFAAAVEALLAQSKTPRKKITALASHGQTICHLPPKSPHKKNRAAFPRMNPFRAIDPPSTLQLGDPSTLATLTGITTVGNFRPADMAVGGQGAPLVPFADDVLLAHPTKIRAVQNIGGIANVTYLPPLRDKNRCILAFDTGPGNMLFDAVVTLATAGQARYDHDGQRAAQGFIDHPLFKKLQAHPYFRQAPPKSTGREQFGAHFARRLLARIKNQPSKINDLVHTLTRLTAWSIADAYRNFLPQPPNEVILCGGGADNPTLVRMLTEEFTAATTLRRMDEFGIPNKSKEAASFALLAAATLDGIAANLPTVTGAARSVMLGLIAPAPQKHSSTAKYPYST